MIKGQRETASVEPDLRIRAIAALPLDADTELALMDLMRVAGAYLNEYGGEYPL